MVKGLSGDPDTAFFFHLTGIRNDMVDRKTTHYPGNPDEVSTAIDPIKKRIWHRGQQ